LDDLLALNHHYSKVEFSLDGGQSLMVARLIRTPELLWSRLIDIQIILSEPDKTNIYTVSKGNKHFGECSARHFRLSILFSASITPE